MAKNYYEITLALSGVCQSAYMVQQLAHKGYCHDAALSVSLSSLLHINPKSTLAVFNNDENNLYLGLKTLLTVLNSHNHRKGNIELMRYTLSLMMLERKLKGNKQAQSNLIERINQLDRQRVHYELESDTIINIISSIYLDIISPLGPRIQVTGSQVLQNIQVQCKVRAILLTGIRSAVLWQQIGGSRLQLMFSRQKLLEEAKTILSRLSTSY
ncbi:high frequency lysogenization protein HflD [Pantoea sp. Aalb]|uniref:high frequency lysogenization protein HflD n=1 Tax=Pantoea sp. Aalb TaxID=2576762 RepID=UPI001326E735|nr:high frequency lysogenization protein HflD [Pantoea sp. Aalb]MXP67446.1 high frequency lysogenization protein HflD [Pantoea sp. Aalb]